MYHKALKYIFNNKPFCNDVFFLCFAVGLLLLSIKSPIFFLFLFGYLIFIYKKTKYIFPIILLSIGVLLSFYLQSNQRLQMEEGIYEGVFEVVDSKENYIILKEKRNILVYNHFSLKSGDIIEAKIEISKFKEKRYSSDFDRTSYYASKRIFNQGKIISFKPIGHKVSTSSIRQKILEYYQANLKEKSYAYIKACFFGIVELEEEVQEAYSSLFISHILTISGVHILFLFHIFNFLFQKIFKREGSVFSIGILFGYIWFIGFPVSAIRAFLFLVLSYLNRFGIVKYTKLDIWSISFLIIVLINPYLFYQMSFILSFIISFILIFKDEFNCFRIKFMKSFFISMLCILSILPFLIQMNHQLSLSGILLSFILSFILGKYLLPFIFIILIFPVSTYEYVFIILDKILITLNPKFFVFKVPSLPTICILIYYFLFYFLLLTLALKKYKIKYFVMFFSYLFILIFLRYENPLYRITFIDVGQGDSALIEMPYERGNILIDSFADNYKYLKNVGIHRLDAVILTHFDYDHMGSIEHIVKEFNVKALYYSKYENPSKIENLNVKKISVGQGDSFKISSLRFQILGPVKPYSDANSNSVVLSFKIKEFKFLFTGDMTMEEELDIIEIYKTSLKSDVLKVGHHGSKTSSSEQFLQMVRPSVSIISVGNKNQYHLPDSIIVDRLKVISDLYLTKDCGNVQILIGKKMKIIPYRKK